MVQVEYVPEWDLKSARYWRCLAIAFCAFSIIGHWMEIPYCLFMDASFGIVDDNSLVFVDPFYPFLVYGIAAVACALFLVPLRLWITRITTNRLIALIQFYLLAVVASMTVELVMGLILNQPDPLTGIYPLWDNSQLPLNIFGQAWLVNDMLLGAVVTIYVWVLYPFLARIVYRIPRSWGWPAAIIIVAGFVALCIVKFS